MPIIEFKCQLCGHIFERLLKASVNEAKCPLCYDTAKRLYRGRGPVIHFKEKKIEYEKPRIRSRVKK